MVGKFRMILLYLRTRNAIINITVCWEEDQSFLHPLACRLWLRGRWIRCLCTRSTSLQNVSFRAALCILSSTASCPGRAQQGCEWDTQITKFCQNHRACGCQRYLLPLLNYQGFRRSRKCGESRRASNDRKYVDLLWVYSLKIWFFFFYEFPGW